MAKILIPSIGVAMEEALLVKWLKQPGEEVAADEAVAEIETDKTQMDLTSPVGGILGPHLVETGAIIPVGTAIAEVLEGGESAPEVAQPEAAAADAEPQRAETPPPARAGGDGDRSPHALSPRARRAARQPQVREPQVQEPEAREPEVQAPAQADRFRAIIAAKVTESWREIPHFSVSRQVDAESMLASLDLLRTAGSEPPPTLTDVLLRSLALGLQDWGHLGPDDVGLAVATEFGVVIPVVRGVLGLDSAGLARARKAAVDRARAGRLSPGDLAEPPASTLSNLGAFGVDQFTGIIALGQTSLLTVGRAAPRVVAEDAHTLRIRTTLFATLNADHRVIDGAAAARILAAFAAAAEAAPSRF